MPITLTPPEIDRRHHTGEGDGGGRKPPTDKRTGGNGEGDNWSDRPQGRRGPRERLAQARVGLFFALGGDLMFFVALISVFFVTKSSGRFDPHGHYVYEWLPTAVPKILWINTIVLMVSSFTAEMARRSMFREHDVMDEWIGFGRPLSRRAGIWLGLTLLLGTLFLAGQWTAWSQLAAQHVFFLANPSRHYFYIITATHAVHLLLGIVGLIAALVLLRFSRSMSRRQVLVDSTVWYWHVMGVLWVFLFALLEFGQ